jgi:hypothetical protein
MARKFCVNESSIRDWRRERICTQSSSHWHNSYEQETKFLEVEEKFSSYLDEIWLFGYVLPSEMYHLKALEIAIVFGFQVFNISRSLLQNVCK